MGKPLDEVPCGHFYFTALYNMVFATHRIISRAISLGRHNYCLCEDITKSMGRSLWITMASQNTHLHMQKPYLKPYLLFQSSVTFTSLFVALLCAVIIFISTIITYSKVGAYRSIRSRSNKIDNSLLLVGMVSSVSTFLLALAEVNPLLHLYSLWGKCS